MDLQEKLDSRRAVVAVIGLGYVGLPLAVVFAEAGFRVVGIDLDETKVESLQRAESYVQDIPSEVLARLVSPDTGDGAVNGRLSASADFESLGHADAIIVCVPTPLSKTREPDISYIVSATDEIAKRLRPGTLVVLESTTYPGTTEEVILPRLQVAGGQTLTVGEDFFLAFSPERIDPGRTDWTVRNTPKVVGGVTAACTQAAGALYGSVVDQVVPVSTSRVAEMVKLLENTFRATNIALVNETALMCERLDIDVWEVIDAAKTKPFGFMPFYPGPGLGGHCIPIDPFYLTWKAKEMGMNTRFIELAGEINTYMPNYVAQKVSDALNTVGKSVKRSKILVLGLAYKKNVDDLRESPSLELIDILINKGAIVDYCDPYFPTIPHTRKHQFELAAKPLNKNTLKSADLVLLATDHDDFDYDLIEKESPVIIDTRGKFFNSIDKVIKA